MSKEKCRACNRTGKLVYSNTGIENDCMYCNGFGVVESKVMTNNIPYHDRAEELEDLIRIALSIQKPMWSNRAEYVLKLIQKSNLQSRIDELNNIYDQRVIVAGMGRSEFMVEANEIKRSITALEKELEGLK